MRRSAGLALAAALLFAVLVLPNHPGAMTWGALARWPLELPVLLLSMIALGNRRWLSGAVAVLLTATVLLKLADYAMFEAFDRSFNPLLDMFLVRAGVTLLGGSIGAVQSAFVLIGAAGALALLAFALYRGLNLWASVGVAGTLRAVAGGAALVAAGWAAADVAHNLKLVTRASDPPGTAWTTRLAVRRGIEVQDAAVALARFAREAQHDPYADAVGTLDALEKRDVILIWIESYGRASFDNPLYAGTHLPTLQAAEADIAGAGLAMKSGWLTSPTAGGRSWLAHGALASGLWTSDQGRYRAMLASGHKWLFHHAQDAGYRTAAVMPAITAPWPESRRMGFDRVIPAAKMGYRGQPFRWVTMPDQFTLAAYPSLLPPDPRPDFVQIALISSHAPWTPIAELVPWESVGDGTIFNEMSARGPTPKALWKNRDDVREAYRRSVDYALRVAFSFVARQGEAAPLIIVVGDHQAAGFIAQSKNRDVAVHMIGPPAVLARIAHWGWTDGLIPAAQAPVRRMDSFRNDFLAAFTRSADSARVSP